MTKKSPSTYRLPRVVTTPVNELTPVTVRIPTVVDPVPIVA